MKQALLYKFKPQQMLDLLTGRLSIAVFKRDLPKWAKDKLARGEIVEGYGYCTKGKPYLINHPYHSYMLIDDNSFDNLNGLVVVKFEVSGTTRYVDCSDCTNTENGHECENDFMYLLSVDPILRKETCLTSDEIEDYGNGKDLYALHISKVEILDEVMRLDDFVMWDEKRWYTDDNAWATHWKPVTRPPQNMMSVWVKGE
jgi:hypothetical protein